MVKRWTCDTWPREAGKSLKYWPTMRAKTQCKHDALIQIYIEAVLCNWSNSCLSVISWVQRKERLSVTCTGISSFMKKQFEKFNITACLDQRLYVKINIDLLGFPLQHLHLKEFSQAAGTIIQGAAALKMIRKVEEGWSWQRGYRRLFHATV